jgi:hypothetical protein
MEEYKTKQDDKKSNNRCKSMKKREKRKEPIEKERGGEEREERRLTKGGPSDESVKQIINLSFTLQSGTEASLSLSLAH